MPPKRSRATTSLVSFQPVQHSFLNPLAANYYQEFMAKDKAIICEVQFQPSADDGLILTTLQQRRWETIAVLGGEANVYAVREFYANLKAAKADRPVIVRHQLINFSAEAINTYLGLENDASDDFQTMLDAGPDYELILREMGFRGSTWTYSSQDQARPLHILSSCLNRYAQAWCKFIRGNLMPTSQKSELTKERVAMLYCILTGRSINVGRLIHRNILACCRGSGTGGHIHPVLITHLCVAAVVPMSSTDEPWIQQMVYSSAKIARIADWPHGIARINGLGFDDLDDAGDIPPPPVAHPRARRMRDEEARREARTKHRYEGHSAAPSTIGASSSSEPHTPYTIDDVGRMVAPLAVQLEQLHARQTRLEQRFLDHSLFIAQYLEARHAHHGESSPPAPPVPTYPAHLLRPFPDPRDDDNDDTSGSD